MATRNRMRMPHGCGALALAAALVALSQPARAQTADVGNLERLRQQNGVLNSRMGTWTWGLGFQFLRLGVLRRPDEPGFRRNYETELQWLNPQLTLQITMRPRRTPWRSFDPVTRAPFQAISVSAIVIAGLNTANSRSSEVGLGMTVNFLDGILGVGFAVDLYRGVPVLNGDGVAGGDVAPTGIFPSAFTRDGEFTAENIFMLLNLNVLALGRAVTP